GAKSAAGTAAGYGEEISRRQRTSMPGARQPSLLPSQRAYCFVGKIRGAAIDKEADVIGAGKRIRRGDRGHRRQPARRGASRNRKLQSQAKERQAQKSLDPRHP